MKPHLLSSFVCKQIHLILERKRAPSHSNLALQKSTNRKDYWKILNKITKRRRQYNIGHFFQSESRQIIYIIRFALPLIIMFARSFVCLFVCLREANTFKIRNQTVTSFCVSTWSKLNQSYPLLVVSQSPMLNSRLKWRAIQFWRETANNFYKFSISILVTQH